MLTQKVHNQERKMKLRWFTMLSTLPLLGVVTAFGLVPQTDSSLTPQATTAIEITLPEATPEVPSNNTFWRSEQVKRGDTVAELLSRLNVNDAAASQYLRQSPDADAFRKLPVGKEVQVEIAANGALISLRYLTKDGAQAVISKHGDRFHARVQAAQVEKRLVVRSGEIKGSLYGATDAAGLPDAVANQLAEIFSGDIDYHNDLRKGDRFNVVYETTYSNGTLVKVGKIQAAEFVNQGVAFRAVYFQPNANHEGSYYTPDGKSMRKAFLRTPIEFSRVSSGFSMARFHPVLNTWRAHKGTDFSAPTGTSIRVTGDGVIASAGWQNGYGNVVVVSHQGGRYSTLYGHMSRFAASAKRGARVTQGDVIGYVGATGLASGPHLHYEFKVDGVQRDPMRIALPNAVPLEGAQRAAFMAFSKQMVARMNVERSANLAKLN